MSIDKKDLDALLDVFDDETQKFTGEQIEDHHLFLVQLFAVTYSIDIPFIEIYETKKTKEIMYQYFIAKKDGSYTKDTHNKQ